MSRHRTPESEPCSHEWDVLAVHIPGGYMICSWLVCVLCAERAHWFDQTVN